jgi:hypothetical protein
MVHPFYRLVVKNQVEKGCCFLEVSMDLMIFNRRLYWMNQPHYCIVLV